MQVPIVWPTLRADLPGEETYVLPLHQDYATTRSRTAWRLWIPLRAVDRHHGTMVVAPGSHRAGPYSYDRASSGGWAIPQHELDRRGLDTLTLEMDAGDGVIFSPWLVHGSVPNASQRTKWVLLLHVQDLSAFVDPTDPDDPLRQFMDLSEARREERAGSIANAAPPPAAPEPVHPRRVRDV
jgi:ectoine hydroxylase-related dioxygenase (phytanoyl-CoA dioxygenase family)